MTLQHHASSSRILAALAFLALAACSDESSGPDPGAGIDAVDDGSGAGDVTDDTNVDPDVTDAGDVDGGQPDADADDPDGGAPDTDAEPADGSTEGDADIDSDGSGESDGSAVTSECGDGVVEGDEFCDDENEDETDGCLADCRTTTEVTGDVVIDEFAVAGVTITATSGDEVYTTVTSEVDGIFTLYLPAGEWTLGASLSTFTIVSDDSPYTSEGSGTDDIGFTLLTSTVDITPDAYGPSSFAEPADLPTEEALQFRTFDGDGDGDWFIIDTDETGPIGLHTINLGSTTDTRFFAYDAAEFVLGSEDNDDLADMGPTAISREDVVDTDSLLILPIEGSDVTEYVVFLGNNDHPCGLGSYFLGVASGDLLLNADSDRYVALKDCDDTDEDVWPGQVEDYENDFDDNCDGFVAPSEYVDFGLGNLSRETAYELMLGDDYYTRELNIVEDRFADLTLDSFQGLETHWYSVVVPPQGVVEFDTYDFVFYCDGYARFFWDDETEEAGEPEGGDQLLNDTDAPRTLYIEFSSDISDAIGETPAEWCVVAPYVFDLGFDRDEDGYSSNGYGYNRDLDDSDDTLGSCNDPDFTGEGGA